MAPTMVMAMAVLFILFALQELVLLLMNVEVGLPVTVMATPLAKAEALPMLWTTFAITTM